MSEYREKELYDTLVEIKRDKVEEEEVGEPTSKKKTPSGRITIVREGRIDNTRQKQKTRPFASHLRVNILLPKEK